jgi:hypothetical protein
VTALKHSSIQAKSSGAPTIIGAFGCKDMSDVVPISQRVNKPNNKLVNESHKSHAKKLVTYKKQACK